MPEYPPEVDDVNAGKLSEHFGLSPERSFDEFVGLVVASNGLYRAARVKFPGRKDPKIKFFDAGIDVASYHNSTAQNCPPGIAANYKRLPSELNPEEVDRELQKRMSSLFRTARHDDQLHTAMDWITEHLYEENALTRQG